MAIVVDPLFNTTPFTRESSPRCFRNTLACHMMTTLPGEQGKQELIAFAKRLGLKPEWIQNPGTKRQHFDLVQSKRARAVQLGAIEVPSHWIHGDSRKIRDFKHHDYCNHPEHNPPGLVSLPPGVYEHTCPRCNRKFVFVVPDGPRLAGQWTAL